MKNYQLTLVLKTSLSDANRKKLLDTIKSWLKGAKFGKDENLGQKNLSYMIKKETTGIYHDISFELKDIEKDFEKRLATSDGVLRHLLLRI